MTAAGLAPAPASARVLGDDPACVVEGDAHWDVEDGQARLRVTCASGTGTMTPVEAFPGVSVLFNDFRMERCASGFTTTGEVFCVDWCQQGRIEQPMPGGACAYVASGDLKVDDRSHHTGTFVLPTGRYRGITVAFELPAAQASIDRVLGGFPVDLAAFRHRLCRDGRPYLLRDCAGAVHIFSELACAPRASLKSWCQVKALELLLYLASLDPLPSDGQLPYFPRSQVERVKAACAAMTADLSASLTVEEAARVAQMPVTTFKACFRGVYGTSPAAYVRGLRMERAAQMLRETNLRAADVGVAVGYDSPSKFSAAFKAAHGMTPSAYRRS